MSAFSNPAFWVAIAGVVTAVTGLVKAMHAKDSADSANALLELHQENHAPSPVDDAPPVLSQPVTENPEKS